jgi:hypothetical protein
LSYAYFSPVKQIRDHWMIPFDGRRPFEAPEYLAVLAKYRRLLTSWLLKPNVGLCAGFWTPAITRV